MPYKYFPVFVIFFAAGTFAGSFFGSFYAGLFFVLVGAVFLLLGKLAERPVLYVYAGLVLVSFGAGIFYYGIRAVPPGGISVFENKLDQKADIEGIVVDEPDERENYTGLTVESDGVKILVFADRYPAFKYGDKVEIKGVLKKPEAYQDFDYPAYLAKDDIYFQMFYPDIALISHGNGSWIKQKLFAFKGALISNVSRVIPEPYSALLGGLTLGAKRSLSEDLLLKFRQTGIVHIVVLSGYNVTIVADAVMRVLGFLPVFAGISFGILGIVAFAIMAGGTATIVRASIMAIMVLLARATGRIYGVTLALLSAGFIMVLHNPKIVRFDSSFQLSFLATLALIFLEPIVARRLRFLPKKWQIRDLAAATLSTQVFVLPLILYKMGMFSVVSLPVNLLVLVSVPAAMFFGFFTAVFGFVSVFLSMPFAWISYALLAYQIKVVEFFASLPFSSFTVDNFPLWAMLAAYAVYAILIWKYGFSKKKS